MSKISKLFGLFTKKEKIILVNIAQEYKLIPIDLKILFKIDMILTEWYYNHAPFFDASCSVCHNRLSDVWYETLQPYDKEWEVVCNDRSCISKVEEVWDRGNTIAKPEIKVIKHEKEKDAIFVDGWSGNRCYRESEIHSMLYGK